MTDQGFYLGQMKIDSLGHSSQDHVSLMINHISMSKGEVIRVGCPPIKPLMKAAHVNEKLQAPVCPGIWSKSNLPCLKGDVHGGEEGAQPADVAPEKTKNKPAQWVHLEIVQQILPRWEVHPAFYRATSVLGIQLRSSHHVPLGKSALQIQTLDLG